MGDFKFVAWNMEWMNDLFGPNNKPARFKEDDANPQHSKKTTVLKRRQDLSGVINDISPDIIVIVEGPNRTDELKIFFDQDLIQGDWETHVQYSKGQTQNIGLAVRVDQGKFKDPPFKCIDTNTLVDNDNNEIFGDFIIDTNDDAIKELYKFERRPLYTEIYPKNGKVFHVLGLHLKSKGIFQAYEWSKWWQMADANRRKLLAQTTRLRQQFIEPYLADDQTKDIPLIVCGDINDGPGMDASEKRLYGSAVERLMGNVWKPHLCLRNAFFDVLNSNKQDKLDFSDIKTTSFKDPIFNDTWHQVWIDHILYTDNLDEEWIKDAYSHRMLPDGKYIWEKYPDASDHNPISVTLSL